MQNSSKVLVFLVLAILLVGCGQFPLHPASTAIVPSEAATQITKDSDAKTMTEIAVITAIPSSSVISSAMLTSTRVPLPTLMPTIDPTKLPILLQSALSVETLDVFNGHSLRRVTGWNRGFDGFEWMDTNHLLLYLIVEKQMGEEAGRVTISYPEVINLDSGKVWLPPSDKPMLRDDRGRPILPRWSAQLGALLASSSNTSTGIYNPDGDLLQTYAGNLIGISPSGTKILISTPSVASAWIDLRNGKRVIFPWQRNPDNSYYIHPIWSADEMQVYAQYHLYGNARTGKIFEMSETTIDGAKTGFLFAHFWGTWVFGGTYMLSRWDGLNDGTPGFLSFFDPVAKTYRNLSALAGIPYDLNELPQSHPCNNSSPSTVTDGRYVWVDCVDGGRLIDLATFKSQIYPDYPEASLDWSPDGNFALIRHAGDSDQKILSAASKELKPVPADAQCLGWHPTKNLLVYLSNKGWTLSILDVRNMSVQKKVTLPAAFYCFDWNINRDKMVLIAEDNSLWQMNYPKLNNIEQLTPPIAGLGWMSSSPDGAHIAFPVGADIYIVDTARKP